MCGIALIISGFRIDLSSLSLDSAPPFPNSEQLEFSIDDLKEALRRRGPDSLGCKKVFIHSTVSPSANEGNVLTVIEHEEACETENTCLLQCDCISFANGDTYKVESGYSIPTFEAKLQFIGATLQLRGVNPIIQPLVDTSGNILVYNGEIFGGIYVGSDSNDAETLMQSLVKCCSCDSHGYKTQYCNRKGQSSIPDILSTIKGPWAIIYWQDSSRTLWFGRDAFGRRSLLVHWPTMEDSRLLLSSVSPSSSVEQSSDFEVGNGISNLNFWEELSCGIYSISMDASKLDGCLVGEVTKHEWTNAMLKELIAWNRTSVEPNLHLVDSEIVPSKSVQDYPMEKNEFPIEIPNIGPNRVSVTAKTVLIALRESVMRRTSLNTIFQLPVILDKRYLFQWQFFFLADWIL